MPLRDLFHGPPSEQTDWESFHSAWANTIVRHLNGGLMPRRYRSQPYARVGGAVEVDVATYEREAAARPESHGGNGPAVATAVWTPPRPAQSFPVDFPAQDVFEVRVHDTQRGRRLVAAVELVSPANKDRPAHRHAFAVKCAAYLQQGVSVVVVDVVTERHDKLYPQLLQVLGLDTPAPWPEGTDLYAIAYRTNKVDDRWQMDTWPYALAVGAPLPTVPLWLASDLAAPLKLETTFEETYRVLLGD
jgi:uncharacterized protein DUF4058